MAYICDRNLGLVIGNSFINNLFPNLKRKHSCEATFQNAVIGTFVIDVAHQRWCEGDSKIIT